MEPFTYTNIFDTKGIEYLVVISFLLLLIPFWRWLNKPLRSPEGIKEAAKALTEALLRIPRGLYYGPDHTWTHLEPSGLARVGMDDFLLHLTGGVDVQFLKDREDQVRKGEPLATLVQDGKRLLIRSPVTGTVIRSHEALKDDPEGLLRDPYRSWLVKIEPDRWQEETGSYRMGKEAEEWAGRELSRFKDFLSSVALQETPEGQPVLQAGGELIDHPLKSMDGEVWERFQQMFLDMNDEGTAPFS